MSPFRYLLATPVHRDADLPAVSLSDEDFICVHRSQSFVLYTNRVSGWRHNDAIDEFTLGDIFPRNTGAAAGAHASVMPGSWSCYLTNFWGSYIAVDINNGIHVLRDPSGTLPCFYCSVGGLLLMASDLDLLLATGLVQPTIDWTNLALLLYVSDLPIERTALSGIHELLPGAALDFVGGLVGTRMGWSPWDHVNRGCPDPSDLRSVILSTVETWATLYPSNIVGVSGGLDSSIVANCLHESAASTTAITISTDDRYGDEAEFAEDLCSRIGLPLIRSRYLLDAVDIDRSSVAHLPRPGGRAQLQAFERALTDAAGSTQASAFFSGVGGDNVFYFTHSARPLVDRYLSDGIGRGAFSTLQDISRLTDSSWVDVLRVASNAGWKRGANYRWRPDPRFLAREILSHLETFPLLHPWLDAPANALPGKAAHIAMLVRAQRYVDGYDRQLPWTAVFPLLSQPVVELCLRIPSWRCCEEGRDRSFAREAFSADLPPAVVDRHTKGGPDGFAYQIIRHYLPDIRERLLDGLLAAHGIIDRHSLDQAFSDQALQRGTDYVRLLLLLDAEAWARHWSGLSAAASTCERRATGV